jgi:ATPase subunit of ABC transporter with duplicated ATPase domains
MYVVSNLTKAFGAQTLFRDVSFQLNPGNRYGLVGANGSGKTTLLRILAGRAEPTAGSVTLPKRARLGYLEQDHFSYEREKIVDVVMMGRRELWQAMREMETLLENADRSFDADRYAELEELVRHQEGYALEARAGEILEGLGIPTAQHRQLLSTLSGGFKLRVLLAQVLAAEPDLLLLDEPTNHLDILSVRWLEKFLVDFRGSTVVVSHDHRFLDNVCTHTLDVDYETVTLYTGNYTASGEAKQAKRELQESEIAKREREIAHHQAFVDRFKAKNTKARQAQSKVKLIERMSVDPLPRTSRRYPVFRFVQCRPTGRQVVRLEGVSKAYGDNQVLTDVSLRLERGDRLAVIGPNGIGKSTLLKILVGLVKPDQGEVEWGYETYPGYFPQDHRDLLADGKHTVESWLWEVCAGETRGFVRGRLGMVLFSGDEVEKKVAHVSGGEAARLIFARLAVEQPNVLVLDEPTNHLDLEGIESLVKGLEAFEGTVLLVSHDRWLVSRLATRILEITPRGMNDFAGSYDEYLERCGDDHLDVERVVLKARRSKRKGKSAPPPRAKPDNRTRQQIKRATDRRDRAAHQLEQAESSLRALEARFCEPGFFDSTPGEQVQKLQHEQRRLSARVDELMAEWEQAERALAELQPEE